MCCTSKRYEQKRLGDDVADVVMRKEREKKGTFRGCDDDVGDVVSQAFCLLVTRLSSDDYVHNVAV